jgi:protein-S-isoprenylcysteine O-methyltransferase Ste14
MTAQRAATGAPRKEPLAFLMVPWVDKVIAIVAMVPFVYYVYARFRISGWSLPWIAFAIHIFVLISTMIVRRVPVRITTNPWFWLLTFVETYWGVLTLGLTTPGRPLAPNWVTDSIAIVSLGLALWARLSLGRSIGLVPALRKLVTHGVYRYMRHPIYSAISISLVGVALRSYSPRNLVIFGLGIFWFCLKSVVEESFLRSADPEYAAYMQRVRWRWIPGIA